ncbi:MAG: DNA-processing protein DprA [Desulfovibrionaceae bacterium]
MTPTAPSAPPAPGMDAAREREFFATLALRHTPRLGPRTWRGLLAAYASAYAALRAAAEWPERRLAGPALAAKVRAEVWRPGAEAEYRAARALGAPVLLYTDPIYPDLLRAIPDPPPYLYAEGDLGLLAGPAVAVVGARKATRRGAEAARIVSEALSAMGVTVVSGLAMGVDRQAHLGGLAGVGRSIAVLGAGLDSRYPAANLDVRAALAEHGLVLTEYAPGEGARSEHFPFRNRIIAGLCLGVLVVEAAERSGSLITARLAGEQGREALVLAGPEDDVAWAGCRRLVADGATLVEDAEAVLAALGPELRRAAAAAAAGQTTPASLPESEPAPEPASGAEPDGLAAPAPRPARRSSKKSVRPTSAPAPIPDLTPDEAAVLARVPGKGRRHLDEIAQDLDWESARVSRTLVLLELRGLVRQWPGLRYALAGAMP